MKTLKENDSMRIIAVDCIGEDTVSKYLIERKISSNVYETVNELTIIKGANSMSTGKISLSDLRLILTDASKGL